MELGSAYAIPEAGELLGGRFRVVRLIGSGGIAAVLEATDESSGGTRVAIKLLKPDVFDDPGQRERFRREAAAMASLRHANIVAVIHDGLSDPTYPFLAMEFVDGGTLAGQLRVNRGGASIPDGARIIRSILSGLVCAHAKGIVHRDLKPENVLLTTEGIPKIADFGFARVLDVKLSLTPSGESVGTPTYMSPEQFRGEPADERSDLYALGLIAFEVLSGRRPYPEGTYLQTAAMHLGTDLPRLRKLVPQLPVWLEDFIETCCEKDRKHRYKSSADAFAELTASMSRAGIESAPKQDSPGSIFSRFFGKKP